jgi:large subunit ribosomal protein L2
VDFRRINDDVAATVQRLEYDPNRNAWIALIEYANKDKELSYILAPEGLIAGNVVISGDTTKTLVGNCCKMKNIPVGTSIHNIEMTPGKGGAIIRAAGTFGKLLGKEAEFVILKLSSGEVRKLSGECRATIGVVSNSEHIKEIIGSAGMNRHRGVKPQSRGVAKNPVDHHNGGRTSGGKVLCSRTGKMRRGQKTRNPKKASSLLIVKRRNS